jgi:hypothetical protein
MNVQSYLIKARYEVVGQGAGVVTRSCGWMWSSGGARCPARVVDELTAYCIFYAEREVVDLVDAFEEPATGNRAGRGRRFGGVRRV